MNAEAYDLRKLERALPPEMAPLRRSISRWIAAHSVHSDISIAHAYVEEALYLHRLNRKSSRYAPTALLHSAIMTYARSLERRSDYRPAIKLGERFSSGQLQMHKDILAIRDEGIAHFGPSGPSKPLSEDHALVLFQQGTWQPVITSRRSLFDRPFAEKFLQHLFGTAQILVDVVEERRIKFGLQFQTALEADPQMEARLAACEFDASILGGLSSEILRKQSAGRATFIFPDTPS